MSLIVTLCAVLYVPAAGLNVGVAAAGATIVYAALATALLLKPLATAMALRVCVALTLIGPP